MSKRGRDLRGGDGNGQTSEKANVFCNLATSGAAGSRTSGSHAMLVQKVPCHFRGCGILPRHGGWRAEEWLTQSSPRPPREREESGREELTRRRGDAEEWEEAFAQKDKKGTKGAAGERDGWSTLKSMKTASRTWKAGGKWMCSRGAGCPPRGNGKMACPHGGERIGWRNRKRERNEPRFLQLQRRRNVAPAPHRACGP